MGTYTTDLAYLNTGRYHHGCGHYVNTDGEICYDEFVSMMFPAASIALAKFRRSHKTLKNAKDAFDRYDIDGDGEITYDELVTGMGGEYTANEINA